MFRLGTKGYRHTAQPRANGVRIQNDVVGQVGKHFGRMVVLQSCSRIPRMRCEPSALCNLALKIHPVIPPGSDNKKQKPLAVPVTDTISVIGIGRSNAGPARVTVRG
ncbi:hypothetical protein SAMN05216299_10978 [Nitrosospira sp. Nsp14]|nr:hypothetical protein SAMN05216299_10978 [Nitrosospira sp. Nsp14]